MYIYMCVYIWSGERPQVHWIVRARANRALSFATPSHSASNTRPNIINIYIYIYIYIYKNTYI